METWRSEVRLGWVGGNDGGPGSKADRAARITGIECVYARVWWYVPILTYTTDSPIRVAFLPR